MSSDGVLTWAIPPIPSSGAIDPQWYNAYKFLLKFTDDGAVGGVPRSKTVAIFQSPEVSVDLDGEVGMQPGVIYQKHTPIAVDDFWVTPVGTSLAKNVLGDNYDPPLRGGDYVNFFQPIPDYVTTFEKLSDPQHAAAFNFNSDGSFTYLPVAGYEGLDSFTYRIDAPRAWWELDVSAGYTFSQHNYSNVATVTIQVGKAVRAIIEVQAEEIPQPRIRHRREHRRRQQEQRRGCQRALRTAPWRKRSAGRETLPLAARGRLRA